MACGGLPSRPWAPLLALITCGVLWGVQTLSWSGFFSVTTVTFSMPFPSFFATAAGLWVGGIALRCGRARRVGRRSRSLWLERANIRVRPTHHNGDPFPLDWLIDT